MTINRYLFPVILLATFFLVIALGIMGGYWETRGGGRRGQGLTSATPAAVVLMQDVDGE